MIRIIYFRQIHWGPSQQTFSEFTDSSDSQMSKFGEIDWIFKWIPRVKLEKSSKGGRPLGPIKFLFAFYGPQSSNLNRNGDPLILRKENPSWPLIINPFVNRGSPSFWLTLTWYGQSDRRFHRETSTWWCLYDEGLCRLAVIYHPKSELLLTKIVHCSLVYDSDYVYYYQLVSLLFMHSGTAV